MKVVVAVAVAPFPPQVALTRYVPAIQQVLPTQGFPMATVTPLNSPVMVLTGSFLISTVCPFGFDTVTMTAVGIVGAGETDPLIVILALPEYDGWSVTTCTIGGCAIAGATADPSAKSASIRMGARQNDLLNRTISRRPDDQTMGSIFALDRIIASFRTKSSISWRGGSPRRCLCDARPAPIRPSV